MVHHRRPIWVARNPTKPSIRASSGMMARVSATTCAASASERTSIQVTLNAPSRASFPDAMSTLEPKDTGAHLVRLDHDLQAELVDEPSPVEVALDGCDVTVPHPDEVDARKRDRAAGVRSAPERSRVGAPHDPPSADGVGIGDRGRRVAVRAVRVERCNKEPGVVLIPAVEVPLRDIEGAHGLAPVCTGT